MRELQEQNALVLQDIAEFTIRHVEVEAYVKKLLMAKNIELPCFLPSIRTPITPSDSSVGSTEQPRKSTSRTSVLVATRESIGSIAKIEPQFEERTCCIKASFRRLWLSSFIFFFEQIRIKRNTYL